jgi:hypothetical protein
MHTQRYLHSLIARSHDWTINVSYQGLPADFRSPQASHSMLFNLSRGSRLRDMNV